jgi:hypothetical protein
LIKALTDVQSGQGSSGAMNAPEREKRMGNILLGKFFDLDARFLDRIIAGVNIPEKVRLEVEQSDAWKTYTRFKGPAPANNERQNQAVAVINEIVSWYQSEISPASLRKEYVCSGSNEVPYHAMSVAPLAATPEAKANRNLKPDLYTRIIPALQPRTDMASTLAEVEVIFEHKSNPSWINKPAELLWPTALKAATVMQDGYGYRRNHTLVALWCGNLFRVAVYDRAGGGVTPAFDITKDLDRFLRTVIGFLTVDETRLGLYSDVAADTFTVALNGSTFVAERAPLRVAPYDHLITRGTTCWRANWAPGHRPDDWQTARDDPWPLLLKAAWQYDERTPEWIFLERLRHEPGVPELVAHGHSWTGNGRDSTSFSRDFALSLHPSFRLKTRDGLSPGGGAGKWTSSPWQLSFSAKAR